MNKIKFMIVILFFNSLVFAQYLRKPTGEVFGVFTNKLKVGNIFVYRDFYWRLYERLELYDTILINNKVYYKSKYQNFNGAPTYNRFFTINDDGYYISYDSTRNQATGEIFIYYKKNAKVGDFWVQKHMSITWKKYYHIVLDTNYTWVFWGEYLPTKKIKVTDSILTENYEYWSEDFGLVKYTWTDDPWSGGVAFLWGCVLNDSVYGDTSFTVSVEDKPDMNISDFELYQNYPNPFNAVTTIRYKINKRGFVRLTVYDALGNEIIKLVNQEMSPGTYWVDFDSERLTGRSALPSGVYFYELSVNNRKTTKKMILIK
ncbi:MAG: T9SS type A sorting domain-containing protein [Ignavibacteria bacterium]|nr:T9SS type A sorting domain-containing protein [Ignavibacteria bacterium]